MKIKVCPWCWRFVDEIPLWADDDSGTCGMIKCNNFPRSWISVGNETLRRLRDGLRAWQPFYKTAHKWGQIINADIPTKHKRSIWKTLLFCRNGDVLERESEKSRKSWWLFRANFYDFSRFRHNPGFPS